MDWVNFLKVMVMEEQAARAKYNWAARMAETPQLRAIFEKLRDEEEFHAQFLEGERAKLEKILAQQK